ncbi:MAG: polysaccharide biosynthesis/export family protein [Gammaproteobacteria bacterium]
MSSLISNSVFLRNWGVVLLLAFELMIKSCFAADDGYLINTGDRLRISVWQEENLQAEVMVSPDGTISFPMIGIVAAAGKTIDQLQSFIRQRLEEYIPGPEVNVSLLTVEGNEVYIIGEVNKPGPYMMRKNLDVMQVLSMAGGLTPFAAKNDIHILRRDDAGVSKSIAFPYGDVEDGDSLEANILLKSGDTVIVP